MAIELEVSSVTALVTSEPRERQIWQGKGDDKVAIGRVCDADGRPLSAVSAVVIAEPLGMLGDATVLLPDRQATGLQMGSVVRVEGHTTARLAGGDFATIRTSITGERVTPVGEFQMWVAQGGPAKAGDGKAA